MYCQITSGEKYTLAALHVQRFSQAAIARQLGKHPSPICRELKRNSTRYDGAYRPSRANEQSNGRRSRSRRNRQFGSTELRLVEDLIREDYSPEQVSGILKKAGLLRISHETIYLHCGVTKRAVDCCGSTCAARPSSSASATAATRTAGDWRARR